MNANYEIEITQMGVVTKRFVKLTKTQARATYHHYMKQDGCGVRLLLNGVPLTYAAALKQLGRNRGGAGMCEGVEV